jgi:hypothetical protein
LAKSFVLAVLFCVIGHFGNAQIPVETSATAHDVKINDDKRIQTPSGTRKAKVKTNKAIPADRPVVKRHKSHSEAGVFKRHNHFKRKSGSARKRSTRKNAPAPKT